MAKPTDDIEFATNGAALISDPGGTKKKLGFLVSEKPPAHWFDWLFRAYWRWISWLTTFTAGLQNNVGLTATNSWQYQTATSTQQWRSIVWSPELRLFCAVAQSGLNFQQIMTSPDGTNWIPRTAPSAQQWADITWSPALGLFCAVAINGTIAQQIMTSPDGINWTARTSSSAQQWQDITWSPALGLFCAVAVNGTAAQQIMTSPDGINWTARTSSSAQQWLSVCWSPELGLFCAVALGGLANQQIMTSPDGINWTARTAPSAQQWESVCWSPELRLFCAVAQNGTIAQQIMTSPDGINWTARTSPSVQQWQDITWSPELGLFCVISFGGAPSQQVMTSPDGITWTARTSITQQWQDIEWSPELGLFCAVSYGGVANQQVMTSGLSAIRSIDVQGTTTNDNAPAGNIGEYVFSVIPVASKIGSFTTTVGKTIASISLTPGDWDITGIAQVDGALTGTYIIASINTTGGNALTTRGDSAVSTPTMPTGTIDLSLVIPPLRVTLVIPTTFFLTCGIAFTAGTPGVWGRICARRVR